jgi:hypothetical protein
LTRVLMPAIMANVAVLRRACFGCVGVVLASVFASLDRVLSPPDFDAVRCEGMGWRVRG